MQRQTKNHMDKWNREKNLHPGNWKDIRRWKLGTRRKRKESLKITSDGKQDDAIVDQNTLGKRAISLKSVLGYKLLK